MFMSKLQFNIFELRSTQMHNQLHASILTKVSPMNLFQCCTIWFEPFSNFFIQLFFSNTNCIRTNWKNDVSRIPKGKLVQCTNVRSILTRRQCVLILMLTFFPHRNLLPGVGKLANDKIWTIQWNTSKPNFSAGFSSAFNDSHVTTWINVSIETGAALICTFVMTRRSGVARVSCTCWRVQKCPSLWDTEKKTVQKLPFSSQCNHY